MSKLIDTRHEERVTQARDEGFHAGQMHAEVAARLCPPEEFTDAVRAEWIDTLEWLSKCPYDQDAQPYTDTPYANNYYYGQQWAVAFAQGKHKRQAELRRAAA